MKSEESCLVRQPCAINQGQEQSKCQQTRQRVRKVKQNQIKGSQKAEERGRVEVGGGVWLKSEMQEVREHLNRECP